MALTNLQLTIAAKKVIQGFKRGFPALSIISTKFEEGVSEPGDKIKVPFVDLQTEAQDFVAGTGYTFKEFDSTGVDVALDKNKGVPLTITDKQMSEMAENALEGYFEQMGMILGLAVFKDVNSLVTKAGVGDDGTTVALDTFDASEVNKLRRICTDASWPLMPRGLVLDSSLTEPLFNDDALKTASALGSDEVIREGAIGKLYGFDVYEAAQLPANSENLVGYAIHPSAIALASKACAPADPNAAALVEDLQYIPDPQTGLTFVYRRWYDSDLKRVKTVLEVYYGRALVNKNAIKRLVTSAGVGG